MYGSKGERQLQDSWGTRARAQRFYDRQVRSDLSEKMQALIRRQEMVFIATSDAQGNCDCSPRFGAPGFVEIVDSGRLAYPEFRGNGVFASLGNISENPHIGLVFVDFLDTTVGLHVNGRVEICSPENPPGGLEVPDYLGDQGKMILERWVVIEVEEAYIHCSKHVPILRKADKHIDWGTDDPASKSDSFFLEGRNPGKTGRKPRDGGRRPYPHSPEGQ